MHTHAHKCRHGTPRTAPHPTPPACSTPATPLAFDVKLAKGDRQRSIETKPKSKATTSLSLSTFSLSLSLTLSFSLPAVCPRPESLAKHFTSTSAVKNAQVFFARIFNNFLVFSPSCFVLFHLHSLILFVVPSLCSLLYYCYFGWVGLWLGWAGLAGSLRLL